MGLSLGGSMDKGQAGDGGKRAEVRNGMVTIGRDGPGCWLWVVGKHRSAGSSGIVVYPAKGEEHVDSASWLEIDAI